jgi:hypothetical protein
MLSKVRENDYDTIVAHAALSGASDLKEPARIEPPAWALTPIRPRKFLLTGRDVRPAKIEIHPHP